MSAKSIPKPSTVDQSSKLGNSARRISDLMRINQRFRKSVQIELDFNDPQSTSGYIATDFVVQCFDRISAAFMKGSTQRAWRLTGDYGSGKSAFALALAKSVCGKPFEAPKAFRGNIIGGLRPVIVTGEREPLHETIGKAIIKQVPSMHRMTQPTSSAELAELVERAIKCSEHGIFLILDELGKNLEHAMMEPGRSDVYILQRLAEQASHSSGKPFVVLAILHMGISAYTGDLDTTSRREWDKVAGRFDEILFHHPFEQTVQLCAEALGLDTSKIPDRFACESRQTMKWAVETGLYGSAPAESLEQVAPRIFPLHPVVLPPLMNLLRRFGQNERSLFSFLSGHEPSALQDVAGLEITKARFFRLADLYSYVRHNIAHTMTNGRATHWKIIESVVRKASDADETNLLKTIGILNLIDDDSMLATRELLAKALDQNGTKQGSTLDKVIRKLREKHLLFERGAVRGFALWPHSSVHLDDAFEKARDELGEPNEPMRMVASHLDSRQIVARRHYIETGNLRHFELQFLPAKDYENYCKAAPRHERGADGHVVIFLPENERENRMMIDVLKAGELHPGPEVLVGLSRPPLELLGIAKDLQAWKHVQKTVKELASDEFARRELRAQILAVQERLNEQIDLLLGWNHNPKLVFWFRDGKPDQLEPDGLSSKLSEISKEIYNKCPVITNELINRRVTSSAGSRARTALIEAISQSPDQEFLGMDDSKNPPEMAIYLSVLKAGNLHVRDGDRWKFVIPEKKGDDPCNLRPAFNAIAKVLKAHDAQRVKAPVIFNVLRDSPIGARDGLIPLIIALYMAARSNKIALYEDSTYVHGLDGDAIQRLAKEPECFEFQYCAIEGVRLETFQAIARVFGLEAKETPQVLDVVKPLVHFIASVPDYCRNTKKLSPRATALRHALLTARDPVCLIFQDLPKAVGVPPERGKELGNKVAKLVSEIQGSYDALLNRISASITDVFATTSSIGDFRKELSARSKGIAKSLAESDLKSFVLRLGDEALEFRNWLESLANHIGKKSAMRWTDSDEEVFDHRLGVMAKRMLRAEAAQADVTRKGIGNSGGRVVRLLLTRPDGNEHGELLHWGEKEDAKVSELEVQISAMIRKYGRAGLGATATALWNHLQSQ
jgi:hypothetical protein